MPDQLRRRGEARSYSPPLIALLIALLACLTLASTVSAETEPALVIPPGTLTVAGNAYGTFANVGDTIRSGRSAAIGFGGGCTFAGRALPVHKEDSVASVAIPALGSSTGVVSTEGDAFQTTTRLVVQTKAAAHDVSLLGGLITATEVQAVSKTTFNGTRLQTSAEGSAFVSLIVDGTEIGGNVAPNTRIALAGLGEVVLNERIRHEGERTAGLTVNMIHVHITQQNAFGYPVGTEIIVAHAFSGIKQLPKPVIAIVDGHAYGTLAKGRIVSGGVIRFNSGQSAAISVPCLGTDGKIRSNFVASVEVPSDGSVLNATTIHTTAQGTVGPSSASAETTAEVEAVSVLGTLVQASAVKADAHASSSGDTPSFSDAGSSFGTLSVAGHPEIGADVPANTQVAIAGLGTLWLHRVVQNSNSIEVRMIELEVTVSGNPFGLDVGTTVRVAVASASVHDV
jgi:hypothetical protein